MSELLKNNNNALKEQFGNIISLQLLNAYMTGLQASKKEERELTDLMACHIFDLLDWARRSQKNFQANLAALAFDHPELAFQTAAVQGTLPSSIEELEALVDTHFYQPIPPLEEKIKTNSNKQAKRGKTC